jgi:23S rRNA (cytidine1920-2'-O)/16S rRNA (cytidine1409-2'-O)-methyltransferase
MVLFFVEWKKIEFPIVNFALSIVNCLYYLYSVEERLDKVLLQRGLVSSRVRAEQIIRETGVKVNGKLLTKTGKKIPVDAVIEMMAEELPWVSRGALKLIEALEQWKPEIAGSVCLDIGASTGGFTEVLLDRGVSRVYCVDVGKDQLHPKLRTDERVVNLEKTHVRELTARLVPEQADVCVIDVSFISLAKVIPFIHPFLKENAVVIALVKPQFEVGREHIAKGGVVKNKSLYPQVIEQVQAAAKLNNLEYVAHIPSPILGGDGNEEFLMLLKKSNP